MNSNNPPEQQPKSYKLTTKNLFKHFLLVHDFLYKFTKIQATQPKFLNTQIDIQNIMSKAATRGGQFSQVSGVAIVALYCLNGRSIPLKFLAGFLYVYWLEHINMLGQYMGALIKMPRAYKRLGEYFEESNIQHPHMLDRFEQVMEKENQYEDTHEILKKVFPDLYTSTENSFTTNEYFIKNKDKYNFPTESQYTGQNLKLPYLDSFLTRYIYYSFSRWFHRVKLFLGVVPE